MNMEKDNLLREKSLAFFGTVTASLSHEINNVIAIIGELAGLLDDLLLGAQKGRPVDEEKLKGLSEKIGNQAKKGKTTIKMLNRFAHSIDDPAKDIDLNKLVKEVTALADRFAFLKGVRLERIETEETTTITSNPFNLQQAIFACIAIALEVSEKDDVITLTVNKEEAGARIDVRCVSLVKTDKTDSRLSFLSTLMKELGGTIEILAAEDDTPCLILNLPEAMPVDGVDTDKG